MSRRMFPRFSVCREPLAILNGGTDGGFVTWNTSLFRPWSLVVSFDHCTI